MKQQDRTLLSRERIIAAAMAEFGKNGYKGASVNNICATGIPKGLLYHNFKSKNELYIACVGRCFSGLSECLREANIGAELQRYIEVRLNFFRDNELEARIFFDAVLQPPENLRGQIEGLRAELDEINGGIYRAILKTVALREGITEDDALEYFAMQQVMFNGYFSSPAFRDLTLTDKMAAHESKLAKMLDMMLYGIAEKGETV